jgi:hypothetical protein
LRRYRTDIIVSVLLVLAALVVGIAAHDMVKPFTREIATFAPIVFSVALFGVLGVACVTKRGQLVPVKRFLINLCVVSLFVPAAALKVETLAAPYEAMLGSGPEVVTARIAAGDNFDRYRAWARLVSMSREERDVVAYSLARQLASGDPDARASAELTLEIALRRHTLKALSGLTPELQAYALKQERSPGVEQAAAYAQNFVENNTASIRKALEPKRRKQLPEGGLEALLWALAADEPIGHYYLRQIAAGTDADLQPLALKIMQAAAISPQA